MDFFISGKAPAKLNKLLAVSNAKKGGEGVPEEPSLSPLEKGEKAANEWEGIFRSKEEPFLALTELCRLDFWPFCPSQEGEKEKQEPAKTTISRSLLLLPGIRVIFWHFSPRLTFLFLAARVYSCVPSSYSVSLPACLRRSHYSTLH